MDGSWENLLDTNDFTKYPKGIIYVPVGLVAKSRKVRLYGRIYSDVLMSCRQYLPPGISLGIEMRRRNASFSLLSNSAAETYDIELLSASIFVPRLRLSDSITKSIMSNLGGGVANMTFNRLDCKMMTVPASCQVWRWANVNNFSALPNRVYFALVPQKAVYGSISRAGTYFDTMGLSSFNLQLNGRDVLVEPMLMSFKYDADGKIVDPGSEYNDGFLSVLSVLDQISNQIDHIRLDGGTYLRGSTIYAVDLGRCGEKAGASGVLDIEIMFGEGGCREEACAFVFTEKTAHIAVQTRL